MAHNEYLVPFQDGSLFEKAEPIYRLVDAIADLSKHPDGLCRQGLLERNEDYAEDDGAIQISWTVNPAYFDPCSQDEADYREESNQSDLSNLSEGDKVEVRQALHELAQAYTSALQELNQALDAALWDFVKKELGLEPGTVYDCQLSYRNRLREGKFRLSAVRVCPPDVVIHEYHLHLSGPLVELVGGTTPRDVTASVYGDLDAVRRELKLAGSPGKAPREMSGEELASELSIVANSRNLLKIAASKECLWSALHSWRLLETGPIPCYDNELPCFAWTHDPEKRVVTRAELLQDGSLMLSASAPELPVARDSRQPRAPDSRVFKDIAWLNTCAQKAAHLWTHNESQTTRRAPPPRQLSPQAQHEARVHDMLMCLVHAVAQKHAAHWKARLPRSTVQQSTSLVRLADAPGCLSIGIVERAEALDRSLEPLEALTGLSLQSLQTAVAPYDWRRPGPAALIRWRDAVSAAGANHLDLGSLADHVEALADLYRSIDPVEQEEQMRRERAAAEERSRAEALAHEEAEKAKLKSIRDAIQTLHIAHKSGWGRELSAIIGCHPTNLKRWLKKNMPDAFESLYPDGQLLAKNRTVPA